MFKVFLYILLASAQTVLSFDSLLKSRQERGLVFNTGSAMQFFGAVVSDIEGKKVNYHNRRVGVNVGWNFNYDLPASWQFFFQPTYWPGVGRALESWWSPAGKKLERSVALGPKIPRDVPAGAFYRALGEMMTLYGYHEECLPKMICEFGAHDFHVEEDDLIAEIVHLALTPSEHRAFAKHEAEDEEFFNLAELHGKSGGNCHQIFRDCPKSPLDRFTVVREIYAA